MAVAQAMSARSGCVRRQAGAVIVDLTNRVVSTGYNGPPAHLLLNMVYAECVRDCPRAKPNAMHATNDYSNCFSIHAEANALLYSDRKARENGTIYMWPGVSCYDCGKLIANSGISRVVATIDPERDAHRADQVLKLWRDCDIEFLEWKK